MGMSQESRRLENKKRTLGSQIKSGAPQVNDLREGENIFRQVDGNVIEYIRFNNQLYNKRFESIYSRTEVQSTTSQSPDYDSGWFLVAVNSVYDQTFGWNVSADTLPSIVKILWSDDATPVVGTDEIWEVQSGQILHGSKGMNCYIEYVSSTVIRLHTGDNYTFIASDVGGTGVTSTAGYYKLQVWK